MADVIVTKPTLTYFNTPGRSELSRLILEVAGVDYNFVGLADWTEAKAAYVAAGKAPFGQLPIYEEAGLIMSQSMAMARHLARRHGLAGASEHEAALIDMAAEGVSDVYEAFIKIFYKTPEEQRPPAMVEKFLAEFLPVHLGHLSALLEGNGNNGCLVGAKLSYADLFLWVVLDTVFPRVPGSKELVEGKYPNVKAFLDGVAAQERIKAYHARNVYAAASQ